MSRIDDVLSMKNVAEEAKEELKDAKRAVNDLKSLASVAGSPGGDTLLAMLREDCRDLLLNMLQAKKNGQSEQILAYLSDFEAKFTLFNTIKSAPEDYEYSDNSLNERVEEILEG